MEFELTSEEKRKKIWLEIKDLLVGAAFPVMLMLIFGASILSFVSSSDELPLQVILLVIGEFMLGAAYFVFGRQNGKTARRKTIQQAKKRELGSDDIRARLKVGEYAVWKGFIIALISCIPYVILQIIYGAAPNTVCEFLLKYCFGWAYYPLSFANVSTWLNLIWIIPLTCLHAGAYALGSVQEEKKQRQVAQAQEAAGKKKRK